MYGDLLKSFALWLESRGSSRRNAFFRAGVAFSLYVLVGLTVLAILLTVIAGIPILGWISAHTWFIWVGTAFIALLHWNIVRNLRGQDVEEAARPSPYLWFWYFLPMLALLIIAVGLAIARTT